MKNQSFFVLSSRQSGFTLLEAVIVLGIVALLMGAFISFYRPIKEAQETVNTRQRMERVLDAISSYALMYNRIPCPADPRDPAATGTPFGREVAGCGAGNNKGILPYVTLGLTQDDAKDGYGRYMTYHSYGAAATPQGNSAEQGRTLQLNSGAPPTPSGTTSLFCQNPPPAAISIARTNGGSTMMETLSAFVALVSYGPQGIGGYNVDNANPANRNQPIGDVSSLGTIEQSNAVNMNTGIRIADYSSGGGTNHFDDTVRYLTGPAIVSRLGNSACSAPNVLGIVLPP